jgi:hypothetical protein
LTGVPCQTRRLACELAFGGTEHGHVVEIRMPCACHRAVQCRLTRRRCHDSSGAGVTMRCFHKLPGQRAHEGGQHRAVRPGQTRPVDLEVNPKIQRR